MKKKIFIIFILIILVDLSIFFIHNGVKKDDVLSENIQENEQILEQQENIDTIEEIVFDDDILEDTSENIAEQDNTIETSIETSSKVSTSSSSSSKNVDTTTAQTTTKETTQTTTQVPNTQIEENETTTKEITKQENVTAQKETQVVPQTQYIRNDTMISKIKSVIENNESEYMKTYGYTIVIDSSIKELTNQFTFTENRVKSAITNKFGTIRIYAEDYYVNGQLVMTECYII